MLSGHGLSAPSGGSTNETPLMGPSGYAIGCSGESMGMVAAAECSAQEGSRSFCWCASKTQCEARPWLQHVPPANRRDENDSDRAGSERLTRVAAVAFELLRLAVKACGVGPLSPSRLH
eukprot:816735-Rhodomonas_salina.1